jgi:non-ribosomal peptide synthetase component F
MCEQYVHLLREILERPQADINAVPLLPQRQVDAILALNKGPAAFPHDRCIHSLIEDRVVKHPNAPAIETVDSVVSYAELNRDANKLAHRCESLVYAAAT